MSLQNMHVVVSAPPIWARTVRMSVEWTRTPQASPQRRPAEACQSSPVGKSTTFSLDIDSVNGFTSTAYVDCRNNRMIRRDEDKALGGHLVDALTATKKRLVTTTPTEWQGVNSSDRACLGPEVCCSIAAANITRSTPVIYKITSPSGKAYVGQSINFHGRRRQESMQEGFG